MDKSVSFPTLEVLQLLTFIVVWGFCIYIGFGPWAHSIVVDAHKKWHMTQGHILRTTDKVTYRFTGSDDSPRTDSYTSFVVYTDWQGHRKIAHVNLGGSAPQGAEVDVEVNAKGNTYVPADVNHIDNEDQAPLTPNQGGPKVAGFFGGIIMGILAACVVGLLARLVGWLWGRPRLVLIGRTCSRRIIQKFRDELKLELELHQAKKHLELTPDHKMAVRKRQMLLRRVPIKGKVPKVLLEAIKAADAYLDSVLERELMDCQFDRETIETLHAQVREDIKTRREALSELEARAEKEAKKEQLV